MNINFFKKNRHSEALQRSFAPHEEFVKNAKDEYLAAFDAHYAGRNFSPAPRHFSGWAKGLIAAGAIAAIMISVSVYADGANVSADSPLYPLKRLSENVRVALTPASDQAHVEVILAARRANEIQDISERKPSSTLIAGLSKDFDDAVSSSLSGVKIAVKENVTSNSLSAAPIATPAPASSSSICGQVDSMLSGSAEARASISKNPELTARLEARCGDDSSPSDTTGKGDEGDSHEGNGGGLDLHIKSGIVVP